MLRSVIPGSFIFLFLPLVATAANPPKVAVDIAPVHSLVAQVMNGVGKPDLIIRPGASPHEYSLRPSEAEALSRADVVFWIGEGLTPWLESSIENLASTATTIKLLEVSGLNLYAFREGVTFESHEHHEEDGHEDEHAHDEDGHDDEHGHDDDGHKGEHAHEEDDHHDEHAHQEKDNHGDEHHHDGYDPHAWLDPENAKIWLETIASVLSHTDAANASEYRKNATTAIDNLDAQITSIKARTDQLHDIKFIVFHDAYQYFERRFDIQAAGAISVTDASDPSPKRVKEIRETVLDLNIRCVFTEPQFNPQMVRTVFEDTEVTTIGVMDPLGADIAVGQGHYPQMLEALVSSITRCQN